MQTDEEVTKQRPVKPESVVINMPQNEKLLAVAQVTSPVRDLGIQHIAKATPEQTKRIQLASVVLFVSMFFNWGYQYWLKWTIDWPENGDGAGWDDGSHTNLWNYIVHGDFASEGGIGFVEMLNFFFRFQIWGDVADLAGIIFVLFLMRELMPFVFIGTIVFCWSNRERGEDFFRKITMFWGGYFTIMSFEFSESDYWEFNLLFDCFGFWVAGFAGLLLDPKLIRIPENIGSHKDTFAPHLNQPEWAQNSLATMHAPEEQTNPLAFALFYFPVVYYLIVVNSVMEGGDDDALFLGIMLPIVGFLVGIGLYRLEFLKGFALHLLYSIGYGFIAYFLVIIGFLSDLDDGPPISLVVMVSFIMSIRYHMKNKHRRAIGAMYAIPLTIWIIIMGLLFGWIQVDGW